MVPSLGLGGGVPLCGDTKLGVCIVGAAGRELSGFGVRLYVEFDAVTPRHFPSFGGGVDIVCGGREKAENRPCILMV